ncbi:glycosyltransferase family 2 protein [Catellatospora paridis]|uniref:glycosyltransferase family 2 protein n=1 Tax=Catellatospora paridis TaxID=1617086 RepID=UPI0018AFC199|nr:glycosyltransferase family 2 protein [Catellatospora paridis]
MTLGITAYNNERYLPGALDAALAQEFADFEVVACDNRSTDATWDILQAYAARDARVRVFRNESNLGESGNYARVVSLARGEFFRLTSHDDLMAPALLRRCVQALDDNPAAVASYPQSIVIDHTGQQLFACTDEPAVRQATPAARIAGGMGLLRYSNAVFGLVRMDVLRRTRLHLAFGTADRTLILELVARGQIELVPEYLFYRRGSRDGNDFGGATNARDRYAWLEPELATRRRLRFTGNNEQLRFYRETIRSLAVSELPLRGKAGAIAAFGMVWPATEARIRLGALRRRRGWARDAMTSKDT